MATGQTVPRGPLPPEPPPGPDIVTQGVQALPPVYPDLQPVAAQQRKLLFGTTGQPGEERGVGAVDFIPGVGDAVSIHDAIREKDALGLGAAMAGVAIPPLGKAAKGAKAATKAARGGKALAQGLGDVAELPAARTGKRYAPLPTGDVNAGVDNPPNRLIQTVRNPRRMMYPGIYSDPRQIAAAANEKVVAEDPAMKQLWGV